MPKAKTPTASSEKKTASDKKGEAAKKAPARSAPKKEAAPPPPPPAPVTSAAIAGPGSAAVLDVPAKPRFKSNPPRNPFVGTKNPRLRDR